jgi:hypothetical protein
MFIIFKLTRVQVRQGADGNFVPGLIVKEVSTQEEINHWIEAANHRRCVCVCGCV